MWHITYLTLYDFEVTFYFTRFSLFNVYYSVMLYSFRTAFSKNKEPTMVPIPDPDVEIGKAREMSQNDILRLNRLYNCVKKGDSP